MGVREIDWSLEQWQMGVKDLRRRMILNQYQGGMCISGLLKTTERTPRHPMSPSGPNWVTTDSAV